MKEVLKKVQKKVQKFFNKYKYLIKKYIHIIYMPIPFFILDIATRYFGRKINFFKLNALVPNFFTFIWVLLVMGICLSFKNNKRKILYSIFVFIAMIFFLVNNVYYSVTDNFFDFSLVELASEGSSYMLDSLLNANKLIYVILFLVIVMVIFIVKYMPSRKRNNFKIGVSCFLVFMVLHLFIPTLLGNANNELSWNTWRNPRNIYISFNDNNKSMSLSGLYEYTFRNFYVTYIREKKTNNEEEKDFLDVVYNTPEDNYNTKYTGMFKGKNIVLLQLEGIDSWLFNENDTPTLYGMLNNSFVFNNHYSYYNGGGSTFNSEFAVNTGFLTPVSYTQNAYTFNKNAFDYTLAKLFKQDGYSVNAFHMNTSEYYSRGVNYSNWGYDNYYGLKDLNVYENAEYELDRELVLNETFREKLVPEEGNFLDYIISYSNHTPFSSTKGVCKKILELSYTPEDVALMSLTEEDCARIQAKETDYMVSLLIELLKEKGVFDNTVFVVFTDHYLYTISNQSILDKYKETGNNLINHTPFFIYSSDMRKTNVNQVTSQLNILPTVLNLFGLEYHPNYYIGEDALNPNYSGYVFFSDYSWYDGNVYVDGGVVTNGKYMDPVALEEKNYYINYVIKKNDLTLKYNYFKKLRAKNTEIFFLTINCYFF